MYVVIFFSLLLRNFYKLSFVAVCAGIASKKHLNYQNTVQKSARAAAWSRRAAGTEARPPLLLVFNRTCQ